MMPEPLRLYVDAFGAQFRVSLALQFQYRAAQVIWLLFFVLQPVMYLSIWSAVAGSLGGQVGGYEPRELAAYFLCSMWLIHLTFNGVLVFFEARVRRGDFSPLLLRPIHPIIADIADNLAYKALTLPLLGVATFGLFIARSGCLTAFPGGSLCPHRDACRLASARAARRLGDVLPAHGPARDGRPAELAGFHRRCAAGHARLHADQATGRASADQRRAVLV
jgi:ABC-2 type transport system permease protein